MTDEQKAAFIVAQAAMMNAEIAGMVAENQQRAALGQSMAYVETAFVEVAARYSSTLGHNGVISFFYE